MGTGTSGGITILASISEAVRIGVTGGRSSCQFGFGVGCEFFWFLLTGELQTFPVGKRFLNQRGSGKFEDPAHDNAPEHGWHHDLSFDAHQGANKSGA